MPYNKHFEGTIYSESWLRRVYIDEDRNAAQVARLAGCTRQAVHAALKKFGIPVKGLSAAQRLADFWSGSETPRPRTQFKDTLHSTEWLHQQAIGGDTLAAIARRAGCSSPGLHRAFAAAGLDDLWRAAHQQQIVSGRHARHGNPDTRLRKHYRVTESTRRGEARRTLPRSPCVVCAGPIADVNHKDRNHGNNDIGNLERLCKRCHSRQHALEERIAVAVICHLGVPFSTLHEIARQALLAKPWVSRHEQYTAGIDDSSGLAENVALILVLLRNKMAAEETNGLTRM
jgi:DNA-binding phage protein